MTTPTVLLLLLSFELLAAKKAEMFQSEMLLYTAEVVSCPALWATAMTLKVLNVTLSGNKASSESQCDYVLLQRGRRGTSSTMESLLFPRRNKVIPTHFTLEDKEQ